MPSPVVLKVQFAADGPGDQADGEREDDRRPDGDRHLAGRRLVQRQPHVQAVLDFGGRKIESVVFDPGCRFPDRDPTDNVWPKPTTASAPGRGGCGM